MPVSVASAAKRLCERTQWTLSNLDLQKILYIAHMFHLGETGQPLVPGNFEAWDYGPVKPDLYEMAKVFGSSPVGNIFHGAPDVPGGTTEASTIDSAAASLGAWRPGKLVAVTHWDRGAWAKHYKPGRRGNVIPNNDIIQEYNERLAAARSAA